MTTMMQTSSVVLGSDGVATLAHLLEGGAMLPVQQATACVWSPEKALAAAVLASALIEIRDHSGNPRHAVVVADEIAWVRSEAADHVHAFRRICELLGLEPAWVRAVVERWHAAGHRRRAKLTWRTAA